MKKLPSPAVYEKEFTFMPWGELIREVLDRVAKQTPKKGSVLDLMCGPGYLLGKIKRRRSDLTCTGVDIDGRYITYAKKKYPSIHFVRADSCSWKTSERFDCILCTAGLHHLPYAKHNAFLKKNAYLINDHGVAIVADPYLDLFTTEKERRLAAAKLGYEYLKAVLERNAPDDIVEATLDIMVRDVLPGGEYKSWVRRITSYAKKYFSSIRVIKIWPQTKSGYGEYYLVLRKG